MHPHEEYFARLKASLDAAYAVAQAARAKGFDPVDEVEIKITKDVADRVEGIVGPPGIASILREMEKGGMSREDIAFKIADRLARGEIIKGTKEQLIEQAVRTGVGLITEGVLVAPTEGISKIIIKKNPDGTDYVAVYFTGPIRSAGGTAAALAVVLADIARRAAGVGDYRATDTQAERIVEEVNIYENRAAHLQYKPSDDDIRHIIKNCPVSIEGDPTEEIEVGAFRDVPGFDTNRIRGGVPLVTCEGIAQKAAKVHKYTKKLNLGWDWMEKIIKIKKKENKIEVKPDDTFLEGLVAGRPVFAYPSTKGGFRLRYGHSRTNGIMAKNIHPATMILLDEFPITGTHLKIERPGKGTIISGNELIEPPVVLLDNGTVTKVKTQKDAYALKHKLKTVLFLGDMLIPYCDFTKSNHPLIPGGWCTEWWSQEVQAAEQTVPELKNAKEAFSFAKATQTPLHPDYTPNWHDTSVPELIALANAIKDATRADEKTSIPLTPLVKSCLENLLVEHTVFENTVVFGNDEYEMLSHSLGIAMQDEIGLKRFLTLAEPTKTPMDIIIESSGCTIKPKMPTYIGGRMGRPEKAKERKMEGSPHVLFPTGSQKNRSISKLYKILKTKEQKKTTAIEVARYMCTSCKHVGVSRICVVCSNRAEEDLVCQVCSRSVSSSIHCDKPTKTFDKRPVELVDLFENAKRRIPEVAEEVKGIRELINTGKIPERLEKGLLRAKYGVYVFRDGTARFDATDIPLTHFIPKEIGLSLEKCKELGYTTDYFGNPITSDEQLIPLRHQDILLSENGVDYFIGVCKFIDDLLINLYGIPSFYHVAKKDDLIGQLFIAISPHTSAGVVCRVIGFTRAQVGYGHPYFHTAKRRNADGDEDCIILLLDGLINFSKKFLSNMRGGTMDAPLVLTPAIDPREVDDEAHGVELVDHYPLEFYRAAEKIVAPSDVKIKTVKDVLGKPECYENFPLTHLGGYLDQGPIKTKYVQLDSVPDKIHTEFALHEKLRAVNKQDAAKRVILSHFIPDLYGNLRSFSRQSFRCVNCNESYRRVPLAGKCTECGGNLLLTINKGGIEKYLQISKEVAKRYDLPMYIQQRLELVDKEIKSVFEDDKVKQMGLSDFL